MLVQIVKPDLASVASKRLEELKSKKQELLEIFKIELYQEYLKMFKLERLLWGFPFNKVSPEEFFNFKNVKKAIEKEKRELDKAHRVIIKRIIKILNISKRDESISIYLDLEDCTLLGLD